MPMLGLSNNKERLAKLPDKQTSQLTLMTYFQECTGDEYYAPQRKACWHRVDGSIGAYVTTYGGASEISMLGNLLDLYIKAEGHISEITNTAYADNILRKIINFIHDLQVNRKNYMTSIIRDKCSFYMDLLTKIKSASSIMQQQGVNISTMLKS